jgi:hypothetical protein
MRSYLGLRLNTVMNVNERSLEQDMAAADWFVTKVRNNDSYAQNVYCALCNMRWQVQEVMPVLKNEVWSCSWRYAGEIVANLINCGGGYMDWYCSGMGGVIALPDDEAEQLEESMLRRGYVAEGIVTDEVREDLFKLGWVSVPWD